MHNNQDIAYFIARMSHEIRTPLNAIKGFGDLLISETFGPLNQKQSDYLNKMLLSSDQLLEVINQILDWAKLESGQVVLRQEKINLYNLALEVKSLLEIKALEKNISIEIQGNQVINIEADVTKVRQVLINLVNNSLKFTPEQGKVIIGFQAVNNSTKIYIKDTGVGISQDKLDAIFEPFAQGPSLQNTEKGFGLGLWICKSIIQLHNGKIWGESEVDKGTTMFVELPNKLE